MAGSFRLSNFIVGLVGRVRPRNGMKKNLEKGRGVFGINGERVQLIEVFADSNISLVLK